MNYDTRIMNSFLSKNKEFSKLRKQGKELVVTLKGNSFEYKVSDFSLGTSMRDKLNKLEMELKLPIT